MVGSETTSRQSDGVTYRHDSNGVGVTQWGQTQLDDKTLRSDTDQRAVWSETGAISDDWLC